MEIQAAMDKRKQSGICPELIIENSANGITCMQDNVTSRGNGIPHKQ